jgi:hypothetical protein
MEECVEALDSADWDLEKMMSKVSTQEARGMKKFVSLCRVVSSVFHEFEVEGE